MAAVIPIIKSVLPYLAPILQAALPAFTKKKSEKVDPVVAQQISELQEAVNKNSESTKTLAKAIKALEEAAEINDSVIRRTRTIAVVAVAFAALSFVIAAVSWVK